MQSISSSLFGKLVGWKTTIEITQDCLIINIKGRVTKISWQSLSTPVRFQVSLLGQIVSFKTLEKHYIFPMSAYRSKRQSKARCDQFWIAANIKPVETLLANIDKSLNQQYLRQSTVEYIKVAAAKEHKRWTPWIKSSKAFKPVADKINLLSHYHQWSDKEVARARESYVTNQLQLHQNFFNSVETNPLTPLQQRACVIDNDNNLLLAGAGTGKTSVMVGRAGYLLTSAQAQSNELLLLAYGRKAADEMDERIKKRLQTDAISATTFHSLGLNIIAQVEGKKPSLSIFAEDEKAKSGWIQACFNQFIRDSREYRSLILVYFSKYYYVEKSDFDFKTLGERYQYYNDNDIRTLKDEKVKSFGELHIANWLFTNGIQYEYESKYVYDVTTVERRQYQPDFFLPQLNTYIEYYGTDERGETAPYINQDEYHKAIEWKRETHKQFETDCLEFTYAQHKQGQLISCLKQRVTEKQQTYALLPEEERPQTENVTEAQMFSLLEESGRITVLANMFSQLVGLYKAACLNETLEKNIIAQAEDPKQTVKALALLKPILVAYEQHLQSQSDIDFEDMINKALTYVQTGQFKSPWRYIMVDEFQDISEPRARLVKALRDNNKLTSVFAVGDDWQAIYRFSGADFTLTTKFAEYFGVTSQTVLDKTFRFNNQIGKVATDFVSKNPAQLRKNIDSHKQVNMPAVSLIKRDSPTFNSRSSGIIAEMQNGAIDEVLTKISATVCKPVNVYLLARFWFSLPSQVDINRLNNQYPLLTIECHSFHASKGKEADYVIVMGLKKGAHGFPSEKTTPALVDALLAKQEPYPYAEERRLFYVALTRAKDRVYLIADMTDASPFVEELVEEHDIELDEFETSMSQSFVDEMDCLLCETGTLKKRQGKYGAFYSCSYFPRCDHKEKSCAKCQSPMTRKRYPGFKVCVNTTCDNMLPTCEVCNAEMVLRASKNGDFWGCRNYKGNEPMSCKNGKQAAKINWPELVS